MPPQSPDRMAEQQVDAASRALSGNEASIAAWLVRQDWPPPPEAPESESAQKAKGLAAFQLIQGAREAEARGAIEVALDAYGLAVRIDPAGLPQRLGLARWCGATGAFEAGAALVAGFESWDACSWQLFFAYRLKQEAALPKLQARYREGMARHFELARSQRAIWRQTFAERYLAYRQAENWDAAIAHCEEALALYPEELFIAELLEHEAGPAAQARRTKWLDLEPWVNPTEGTGVP